MTVSSATARNVHETNQAVTNYSFEFKVFLENELSVLVVDRDFVITPLTLGQDYTINGLGHDQGGTVFLTPGGRDKAGTGLSLVLLRQMRFVQETDYSPHDVFPAETHERALDILTMICQELREMMSRAIIAPPNLNEPIQYADLAALLRGAEEALARALEMAERAEEAAQDIARWKNLSTAAYDVPHELMPSAIYHPDSNMILFGVPRGRNGDQGRQGETGERGGRGRTGKQGARGGRGPQGHEGPQGPMGPVHPGPLVGLIDCGGAEHFVETSFDCGQAAAWT